MSEHLAVINWHRNGAVFTDRQYSRGHRWTFDGGIEIAASASPHVVPPPHSVAEAIDPEEAFVASLSSCHMLWFLDIAAREGFTVEHYRDEAKGVMDKNAEGKMAMTLVKLYPLVTFAGDERPSQSQHAAMHHEAHERCFIANSVRTEVRCEPIEG